MGAPSGYYFKSALAFAEIVERLKELGHGEWTEGESAWYGDYVRGSLWGVRMRIFDGHGGGNEFGVYDPRGYMLLDYSRSETPSDDHDARLRNELFPALEVHEWRADERND